MKYNKSAAKNRAVELLAAVKVPDGIGGFDQTYAKLIEVMANVKTSSRRIAVAKQQNLNRIIIEIVIYFYENYMQVDAVRFAGKIYRILEREDISGQKKEIRFMLLQEVDG